MDLVDPVAVALSVTEALRRERIPHALYGALLLAAYGEARETRDVDLAVAQADPRRVSALLDARIGLRTRPAFDRRRFGGLLLSRITLVEGDALNTLEPGARSRRPLARRPRASRGPLTTARLRGSGAGSR